MTAVLFRLRAEARARWRAWVGVGLLAGLAGGVSIAALAGARRTETAYPRFLAGTGAFDVAVVNGTTAANYNRQFDFNQIAALPDVGDALRVRYYFPGGSTPSGRMVDANAIMPFTSVSGEFGTTMNGARVLHGRPPRGQRELAITALAAQRLHVHVGDTLRLRLFGPEAIGAAAARGGDEAVTALFTGAGSQPYTVVGVVAMQGGFAPYTGGIPPLVLPSADFARSHPDADEVICVRLRRGRAGIAAFERELDRLSPGSQVVSVDKSALASAVERSLDVQATALRILGVVVAAVALLLLGQALARQAALESLDHDVLSALGSVRAELGLFGLVRASVVALVAGLAAVVTAIALSPLTPVGVARQAELHPGFEVNLAYVGAGALAVVGVMLFVGAGLAWWEAASGRRGRAGEKPSRVVAALGGWGLSAPATSGLRMAIEPGRGRTAVPVQSTIVGTVLGVATVAAALTFSASLGHLFDRPDLYGWNWDVQVGDQFTSDLSGPARSVARDPSVSAIAYGTVGGVQIGGTRVDALAVEPIRGVIEPVVVAGRAPRRADEVLLGTRTLHAAGAHIGSTVVVGLVERTVRMRVVGRGVFTEATARLGEGAALTFAGMRRLAPDSIHNVVLVRLRDRDRTDAIARELGSSSTSNVYKPVKPNDLADLQRVGGIPFVVASLLALLAAATLAHTLVTSVRRRRRDLAILKTLGFVRTQLSRAVAWQASALAVVAVVVGLPLGIAAGRWVWAVFAGRLGVSTRPVTPVLAVTLLVPATIVLANLVAAVPARLAARTQPAAALRTE